MDHKDPPKVCVAKACSLGCCYWAVVEPLGSETQWELFRSLRVCFCRGKQKLSPFSPCISLFNPYLSGSVPSCTPHHYHSPPYHYDLKAMAPPNYDLEHLMSWAKNIFYCYRLIPSSICCSNGKLQAQSCIQRQWFMIIWESILDILSGTMILRIGQFCPQRHLAMSFCLLNFLLTSRILFKKKKKPIGHRIACIINTLF